MAAPDSNNDASRGRPRGRGGAPAPPLARAAAPRAAAGGASFGFGRDTCGSHRSRPGIAVRRAKLDTRDVTVHRRIPVTTPARTLIDLAREVTHDELVRALRETQFMRRFDLQANREALARRPCRPLRVLLEDLVLTQTRLEDRFLRLCDRHRIPRPLTQQPVLDRRAEFFWPRERVVVETDGWEGHGTPSAFQDDRAMSNALQLQRYVILRFTWADVRRRAARVAKEIRAALAAGSNLGPGG